LYLLRERNLENIPVAFLGAVFQQLGRQCCELHHSEVRWKGPESSASGTIFLVLGIQMFKMIEFEIIWKFINSFFLMPWFIKEK
jgi:hypothetical protein